MASSVYIEEINSKQKMHTFIIICTTYTSALFPKPTTL